MIQADVRAGAKTIIDAVKTAYPTQLLQTYTARPASGGSVPYAYVGEQRTSIAHDSGTRRWQLEQDVVLVFNSFDNELEQAAADALMAIVVDAFTDAPHFAGGNSVGEPVGTRSATDEIGGAAVPAIVITIGRIYYQEGR